VNVRSSPGIYEDLGKTPEFCTITGSPVSDELAVEIGIKSPRTSEDRTNRLLNRFIRKSYNLTLKSAFYYFSHPTLIEITNGKTYNQALTLTIFNGLSVFWTFE
jgi:hypothetical protein